MAGYLASTAAMPQTSIGAFDVTAGVAASADHQAFRAPPRWTLKPAPTWCLKREGQMPQLVIDAWGTVWRYFADHPQVQRRFGTDFKAYSGPYHVST